ncbi:TetR/AcrR family transcriptional regulator [Mesorhizobium sp. VNQ89]|uniref:TetR/AcrR family transcriptional regulator n=1 Tax=Mesorhizobium quangtriensis TaxID=3157709 RepID=UPI0032B8423E
MRDLSKPTTTKEAKPPRGRPRAFDREAALGAATRLFWAKGYEATSIADLTQAMGIGSPSLYAAFGSKEALYAEALDYYRANYQSLFWDKFQRAPTAREAVRTLLVGSAGALSGCSAGTPSGCMIALSSVGSEGHRELGAKVYEARTAGLHALKARLQAAVADGEVPASVDIDALARFVAAVQGGMSIMARDGANQAELESVADVAMTGWDARIAGSRT